ncbi:MAG: alpha/beta hydrolase [Acetobacteraceae bacterium]|nr:alpha/beta hydrolase [Acetobacteraceae bacterium]
MTPFLAGAARAAEPGGFRLTHDEPQGATSAPMAVWGHRPAAWRSDGPVVVVLHGADRNADGYRDAWAPEAERHGFLLLCPEFSREKFPAEWGYNLANTMVGRASGEWWWGVLDRAVDAARAALGAERTRFGLYGHSAGSQFVHRHLWITGAPRVSRFVCANAGWYTFPDAAIPFPHGIGGLDLPEARVNAALARDVTILLGDQDNDPHHRQLRRDGSTDRQGLHRFARGQAFFAACRDLARERGVPFGWRLQAVPGVAHSNRGMAPAAAAILAAG